MRSRASWFRELLIRLRPAHRRDRVEREIDEELRFHVDYQVDDNVEQGMTPRQARKAALRRFGDLDDARNGCRTIQMASLKPRAQGGPLEGLLHDLRHGARSLARRPGFAVAAVLTLALGIGANAAMFSVIETVILAPLPFESTDRVVQLWSRTGNRPNDSFSLGNFRDYENLNDVFSHMAAIQRIGGANLISEHEGRFENLRGYHASADLFDMMGVVPTAGRTFRAEEDVSGVGPVVLLTHAYWLRRFGGEDVIGQTIPLRLSRRRPELNYEIIGVLPPGFRPPPVSGSRGYGSPVELDPKVWVESDLVFPVGLTRSRFNVSTFVLAQLRDGVTPEQARANLQSIAAGIVESDPEQEGLEVTVVPVEELLRQEYGVALGFLWAATALVLLVACASVSSLLLGWGVARERELALRAALGAGARRIFRQLLTEAMVLAAAAGVLGVLLAYWGIAAVKLLAPAGVHRLDGIRLDPGVLGFTLGVSLATVLLVGLWPALRGARQRSSEVLKAGGRGATLARTRPLRTLVTAEVALSLVLLAGAGLMLQSFWNLVGVDTGIAGESLVHVMTRTAPPQLSKYPGSAAQIELLLLVRDRVEAIPGVISFASGGVSMGAYASSAQGTGRDISLADRPRPEAVERSRIADISVAPGYFRTLGIPFLAGSTWDERWWREGYTQGLEYVVISEGMARTFWPGESPVGKIFYWGDRDPDVANQTLDAWQRFQPGDERPDGPRPFEVIGVVGDASIAVGREPTHTVYFALLRFGYQHYIRTAVDPAGLMAGLRREIDAIDPSEVRVWDIETMEQVFARNSADSRFRALLAVLFAVMAMGITCLGLFGVLTYAVAQRTRELGIRVALGAGSSQIVGLVLSQGARMVGLGVALGLVLVFSMTRYISSLLFGIVPLDPPTLVAVAALIFALALLAAYLPARRAVRVDPIEALRQ